MTLEQLAKLSLETGCKVDVHFIGEHIYLVVGMSEPLMFDAGITEHEQAIAFLAVSHAIQQLQDPLSCLLLATQEPPCPSSF